MAIPVDRETFKEYCKRKLGWPTLKIHIDDDGIEDRIDEALQYYADYHFDGSEKVYYKHVVVQADIDNKYFDVPDTTIIGITQMFNIGDPSFGASDIFNVRYQIALNDMYNLTSISMVPYYLAMEHLALIQQLLVGRQPIRYNRHNNRIHVDMDWNNIKVGQYLIFEGYAKLDPTTNPGIWSDRWLQNYATVLIKELHGTILTRYPNLQLSGGGITFNGDRMLTDAQNERKKLEDEMIYTYSLPASDFFG